MPVFYDCEASGLDGLPIEIGWAFVDSNNAIQSEGHLIKAPPSWNLARVWDPQAEALHGITPVQLAALGELPFRIVRRMNDALAGRELFSDSPMDETWLMRMFDEAGDHPAFIIRRTDANVLIAEHATQFGWEGRSLERVRDEALQLAPRMHRAEADARHLAQLWLMVGKEPSAES
jgi:hypothetical protein